MKWYIPVYWVLFFISFSSFSFAQTGWVEQTNPLGYGEEAMIGKVQFVSASEGWIATHDGRFLHSTDGGSSWNIINPFPSDTVACFSDPSVSMSWVGTTHGWNINTIGSLNDGNGAVIYKTTNSGSSWSKINLSNESGAYGIQLQFVDINNGWALIYNFNSGLATFLRTTDGGNTWNLFSGIGLFYFVDSNNGWAYTGSGQGGSQPPFLIYKTTNGGNSWAEQFSDNTAGQYNAIKFSDLNNGWVVGANGKVVKTTNGGTDWTFVTNSGINSLQSCKTVFTLDANNIWIPSKQNDNEQTPYLAVTTDGGLTWGTLTTPFGNPQGSNAIFSIYFCDINNGWVTADYGRIAKYTGATSVDDELISLSDYSLAQNYPNPFNPSTTIKFNIPESGFTTIRVYNLLGSEIATLVNEIKQRGIYQVNFASEDLPSGTYFYSMEVNSFREVKKMILLK